MVRFFAAKVVTGQTLMHWGYAVSGLCPYCGQPDTVFHRVFVCPHFAAERADLCPQRLLREAIAAGPSSLLFSRGWIPHPSRYITTHPPATFECCYEVGGVPQMQPFTFDPNLPIYGDGSGSDPSQPAVARASLAIAQIDGEGCPLKVLTLAVPSGLPQSAAVAERLCLVLANNHLSQKHLAPFVGDCKGALKLADVPVARLPRGLHAGFARNMAIDGVKLTSTEWVKAHQCMDRDDPIPIHAVGNDLCDTRAKAHNLLHAPSPSEMATYKADLAKVKGILKVAAKMLELWPHNKALYGVLPRVRNTDGGGRKNARKPHNFVWRDGIWFCLGCYRQKSSVTSAIDKLSCTGVPSALNVVIKADCGHKLFLAADHTDMVVIFCSACGSHTSTRSRNLKKPCVPVGIGSAAKHSYGGTSLGFFFGIPSVHPESRHRLSRPYPVALADLQFVQVFEGASNCVGHSHAVGAHNEPCVEDLPHDVDLPEADPSLDDLDWLDGIPGLGFEDFDIP